MSSRLINQDVINKWNSAGIDIKTGKPIRCNNISNQLKENIKKLVRIQDEQDAVNRYQWYNLPFDLSSQEVERFLYYRGDLCFFYYEPLDQFLLMPYTLSSGLDLYGRYSFITPVPYADGKADEEIYKKQNAILTDIRLRVLYDIPLTLDGNPGDYAVLLHDYTPQWSQKTVISRQLLNDPLNDVIADMIPFLRTSLLNSTGVNGMKVSNADEYSNVLAASKSVDNAALNSEKWIPITGTIEFQELAATGNGNADQFLMAMQSLDNYRLSLYGLQNGGLFEKRQYQNTGETALNGGNAVGSALQDGLSQRQRFCNIVNSVWGCGVSCEISQQAVNTDLTGDGLSYDNYNTNGSQDLGGYDE